MGSRLIQRTEKPEDSAKGR